jgi:hypothetical protein
VVEMGLFGGEGIGRWMVSLIHGACGIIF